MKAPTAGSHGLEVDRRLLGAVDQLERDLREGDAERAIRRLSRHADLLVEWSFDAPLDRLEAVLGKLEFHRPDHPWILFFLAWVWMSRRHHDRALVTVRRAERRFEETRQGAELRRARFLCRMATGVIAQALGRHDHARRALAEASTLGGLPTRELSPDEERWVRYDPSGMIRFSLQAAALYEEVGLRFSLARAEHNLGVLVLDRGEPVPARRKLERACELKRSGGSRLSLANSLNARGQAERHLGLLGRARRHLEEATSLAEELKHEMVLSYATNNLAEVQRDAGRFEEAEALYQESIEFKERTDNSYGLAFSLGSRADLFLLTGRVTQALDDARRAVDLRSTSRDRLERTRLDAVLARARLAAGEQVATEDLGEAGDELERLDAKGELAVTRWWEASGWLERGEKDRAGEAVQAALDLSRSYQLQHLLAPHAALRPAGLDLTPQDAAAEVEDLVRRTRRPTTDRSGDELPRLSARLFGVFGVSLDGDDVPLSEWRSKKAVSLLAILTHFQGDPIHREQAMEWLWPGEHPQRSRRSLNVALSAVRRGLEAVHPGVSDLIARDGPFYRLDPRAVGDVDVSRFLDIARKADELSRHGYLAAALRRATEALGLVKSEYLASEGYQEWLLGERDRLREMTLDLRLRAAEWSLSLGWTATALDHATQALAADPLRERAWAVLIDVQRRAGDPAAALAAFERCRKVLEQELGVEPSHELQKLGEELRAPSEDPST